MNGGHKRNPHRAEPCGARTHRATLCKGPAMQNGRCRMHGRRSAGKETSIGRVWAKPRPRHGHYSEYGRMLLDIVQDLAARARALRSGAAGG